MSLHVPHSMLESDCASLSKRVFIDEGEGQDAMREWGDSGLRDNKGGWNEVISHFFLSICEPEIISSFSGMWPSRREEKTDAIDFSRLSQTTFVF